MSRLLKSLLASVLCVTGALAGCGDQSPDADVDVQVLPTDASPAAMSAEDAIRLVKASAESGALTTTVQGPYEAPRHKRETCSQIEVERDRSRHPNNPELWTCKLSGMSYVKDVVVMEQTCCKPQQVKVPSSIVLKAAFSQPDQKWHVTGDFSLFDEQQRESWKVDPNTKEIDDL